MVLYDHLVICPACNGKSNPSDEAYCSLCKDEGVVTPDIKRSFINRTCKLDGERKVDCK